LVLWGPCTSAHHCSASSISAQNRGHLQAISAAPAVPPPPPATESTHLFRNAACSMQTSYLGYGQPSPRCEHQMSRPHCQGHFLVTFKIGQVVLSLPPVARTLVNHCKRTATGQNAIERQNASCNPGQASERWQSLSSSSPSRMYRPCHTMRCLPQAPKTTHLLRDAVRFPRPRQPLLPNARKSTCTEPRQRLRAIRCTQQRTVKFGGQQSCELMYPSRCRLAHFARPALDWCLVPGD
jgi:hypothetical protein